MNAKRYLMSINDEEFVLERKKKKLSELKAISSGLSGIDYSKDKIQTSPSDRISKVVAEIVDLENEIFDIEFGIREKRNIVDVLNGLEYKIIVSVYLEDNSLKEVARDLGYSYSYIKHQHLKALKKVEELIK